MVRSGYGTDHVRCDKPDKADRPADRNADPNQSGNSKKHSQPDTPNRDADVPGVLLADGKGIQFFRMQKNSPSADNQGYSFWAQEQISPFWLKRIHLLLVVPESSAITYFAIS